MSDKLDRARELLHEFKGDNYVFGTSCLDQLGRLVAEVGGKAAVVAGGAGKDWAEPIHDAAMHPRNFVSRAIISTPSSVQQSSHGGVLHTSRGCLLLPATRRIPRHRGEPSAPACAACT